MDEIRQFGVAELVRGLADRFHMDIFQAGKLEAADEIVAPDFVWHGAFSPGEDAKGPAGVKGVATAVMTAFPDRRIEHHDSIAEGDRVLLRWSMSGTHKGDLMGIAPTGNSMTLTGFDLFRVADGKLAEMWQEADMMAMMKQLGVA